MPLELGRAIAHRGLSLVAPENTAAAFEAAAAAGARWIEFDVQLSADGHPVVIHDDDVARTTDGRGLVWNLTLAELKALDAGRWFDPGFAGARIPTLRETLDLCLRLDLTPNIEIKVNDTRAAATTTAALAVATEAWPASAPVPLVSSFSLAALETARSVAPGLPRGLLMHQPRDDWRDLAQRLACTTVNLDDDHLSRDLVSAVQAAGYPVLVFTVEEAARARTLWDWGAAGVFTGAPDVVAAAAA